VAQAGSLRLQSWPRQVILFSIARVHREPAALRLDAAVRDAGPRSDLYTIGDESHQLIEGLPQLNPEPRGSNQID
jgi:hypothetical protein